MKGERALITALESHDPDLIYLSLLHIHTKTSSEGYEAMLKKYPKAAHQYAIYCRDNGRPARFNSQRDETFHLAMVQLSQAYSDDQVLENLSTAAKTFKTTGGETALFASRALESHKLLLSRMTELGLNPNPRQTTRDIIRKLLDQGEFQKAEQVKKELKFNDVNFARLKLNALAARQQFAEIEKMARPKRPPAPFEHFIKVCVEAGRVDEAEKYLARLQAKFAIHFATCFFTSFISGFFSKLSNSFPGKG